MDIMTMTKNDFAKELKKKILAGDEILLVDVMNKLCPGNYRVEIYTKEGKMNGASFNYRGFFKFSSEEWPPVSSSGEGEPEVDFNDRDCGINLDLYQKVKIVDDHLLYKSSVMTHNSSKETFKLYFIEDKPLNISNYLI